MLNDIASGGTIRTDVVLFFDDDISSEQHLSAEDLFMRRYLTSAVSREVSTIPVKPAAGMGIRTTKRIQAQHGVFTIHHADPTPIEQLGDSSHVWRLRIPQERKEPIMDELRRLQITKLTVFPDLDNVATEAQRGF